MKIERKIYDKPTIVLSPFIIKTRLKYQKVNPRKFKPLLYINENKGKGFHSS